MITNPSLDGLENELLQRMASYRQYQNNRSVIPVTVIVTACALVAGLGVGAFHARGPAAISSEGVVLADDVSLAPSSRLVASQ